ncbi:hypothetical protein IAQ61_004217 [Plenodomus lingam]|uniref:uncharacterized protein n=1 Tax=Leptosphaeria maculans TaxID=5022 RepID=UPI003327658F|nr:hypothetical protein IAQ61_004217 [Plenodomus lingam]
MLEGVGIAGHGDAPEAFFEVVDFGVEQHQFVAPRVFVAGEDGADPVDGVLGDAVDGDSVGDLGGEPETLDAFAHVDVCLDIVAFDILRPSGDCVEEVLDHLEFENVLGGELGRVRGCGDLAESKVEAVVIVAVAIGKCVWKYLVDVKVSDMSNVDLWASHGSQCPRSPMNVTYTKNCTRGMEV